MVIYTEVIQNSDGVRISFDSCCAKNDTEIYSKKTNCSDSWMKSVNFLTDEPHGYSIKGFIQQFWLEVVPVKVIYIKNEIK